MSWFRRLWNKREKAKPMQVQMPDGDVTKMAIGLSLAEKQSLGRISTGALKIFFNIFGRELSFAESLRESATAELLRTKYSEWDYERFEIYTHIVEAMTETILKCRNRIPKEHVNALEDKISTLMKTLRVREET